MTLQFSILRKDWGFEICVQSEDKAAAAKPENNKEIEIVEADQSEDG